MAQGPIRTITADFADTNLEPQFLPIFTSPYPFKVLSLRYNTKSGTATGILKINDETEIGNTLNITDEKKTENYTSEEVWEADDIIGIRIDNTNNALNTLSVVLKLEEIEEESA